MTNIGTLIYLLWFLGPSSISFNIFYENNACSLNESFALIDTKDNSDFSLYANDSIQFPKHKIVIDAGHGGRDHGCSGSFTDEKTITLAIAIELGNQITKLLPGVEVIYTRESDIFLPLHSRIHLANKEKASVFISIHANSFHDKEINGAEIFVMGLHSENENLRVAERENASILLENNFTENYNGFDPSSTEGQIILSMYRNIFLDKSILLAKKISTKIAHLTLLSSRGVKQAGFVILKEASMPSVLIETGFMTNQSDEGLLRTKVGQDKIAKAIAKAVQEYMEEMDLESKELRLAKMENKEKVPSESLTNSPREIVFKGQHSDLKE